jgi:hypothetical protein
MDLDLSICIVNFNTKDMLARTLRAALEDCSGLTAEAIVVDNGSCDGSAAMVRERFPNVQLIANEGNRFFSAAYNQALAKSAGHYILVLNSDVEVLPGSLHALFNYMQANEVVGAATAQMRFPDERVQRICARFPSYEYLLMEQTFLGTIFYARRERSRRWRWYGGWDRLEPRAVQVIPGSFMLVRREAIEEVGGFDERLRLYFSDDDWCLRAGSAGYRIMYLPEGRAVHLEGISAGRIPYTARRLFFEDMHAYAAKHHGRRRAAALKLLSWPTRMGMALAARARGG